VLNGLKPMSVKLIQFLFLEIKGFKKIDKKRKTFLILILLTVAQIIQGGVNTIPPDESEFFYDPIQVDPK
jgi:hypothetical protein